MKHQRRPGEPIQRWERMTATPGQPVAVTMSPDAPYVMALRDAAGRQVDATLEPRLSGGSGGRLRDLGIDDLDGWVCASVGTVAPASLGLWIAFGAARRRRRAG